jgi:hypothetical protein
MAKNPRGKLFYARRKDSNHALIAEALAGAGYRVYDTHKQGDGFPDLLCVSRSGIPVLFEIKLPGEVLTKAERKFFEGYAAPLNKIEQSEEALAVMKEWDKCIVIEVQ